MKRFYLKVIKEHFQENRQMLFLMGPRQVGKTTLAELLIEGDGPSFYFNYDREIDRMLILEGSNAIAERAGLLGAVEIPPLVVFDELHKRRLWTIFLKGLFDSYPNKLHILVMGSARLNVYQRGGDSMMGRYFYYRIHPLSVGELVDSETIPESYRPMPTQIDEAQWEALWRFGGFPDPFLKADSRFYNRWKRMRAQQIFQEDLRDISRVEHISQIEHLAELIRQQVGQGTSYTSLSRQILAAIGSVRRWLNLLTSIYYCFPVRPWSKNLARSLRKEPKYYLWDWSLCDDEGARAENMVASHLYKTVHFWTDHGMGQFELYYLRDKEKREVDFLVAKDGEPWMLVEVKRSNSRSISPALKYYAERLPAKHVFQVVFDLPYVDVDCFSYDHPIIVPARTFLSQLV